MNKEQLKELNELYSYGDYDFLLELKKVCKKEDVKKVIRAIVLNDFWVIYPDYKLQYTLEEYTQKFFENEEERKEFKKVCEKYNNNFEDYDAEQEYFEIIKDLCQKYNITQEE